ncbi:MAG: response regulator transcription factor [Bacteroidales bacterium]|nr:response regulator transcription factor [Bacteroidales bacterium]
MKKVRLIIVEDDRDIREGFMSIFSAHPDIEPAGSFSDGESFLEKFREIEADVALMDIHLPGISGIECTRIVRQAVPSLQVLMCTVYEDDEMVFESLKAGANGYVLKKSSSEKLAEAVIDIYNGGSPMSQVIARKVTGSFQNAKKQEEETRNLTKREKEILEYLAKGYRYKEIAAKLFISAETVRTHIRNIYEKLHVQSRTEALNKAFPRDNT